MNNNYANASNKNQIYVQTKNKMPNKDIYIGQNQNPQIRKKSDTNSNSTKNTNYSKGSISTNHTDYNRNSKPINNIKHAKTFERNKNINYNKINNPNINNINHNQTFNSNKVQPTSAKKKRVGNKKKVKFNEKVSVITVVSYKKYNKIDDNLGLEDIYNKSCNFDYNDNMANNNSKKNKGNNCECYIF